MIEHANERNVFVARCWEETNNSVAIASLIHVGVPETVVVRLIAATVDLREFRGKLIE
jgi:hypothetical protein